MMRSVAIIGMILAVLLFGVSAQAVDFSLGGEFIRGIGVQNIVIIHEGPFGIHLGGALDRQDSQSREFESAIFGAYGSFLLKYYMPLNTLPLSAYMGVGFIGVWVDLSARAESETVALGSGAVLGQQVVAGLELGSPNQLAALYAGLTYVDVPELSMNLLGQATRIPLATHGITFHLGVRLDLRL